jgi:hypothetical protein
MNYAMAHSLTVRGKWGPFLDAAVLRVYSNVLYRCSVLVGMLNGTVA